MGRITHSKNSDGFTLIETLVVLMIISIMYSFITLQLIPNADSDLRDESERLRFIIKNGMMNARAGGQSFAVSIDKNSYSFWRRNKEGVWEVIDRDPMLRKRTLLDTVHIDSVQIDGHAIKTKDLIVLSPELSAKSFNIALSSDHSKTVIKGNDLGEIELSFL